MGAEAWDQRYAASDAVWSTTPNMWVEQVAADLAPGTALDLGAGEGRNALWLAERGWRSTAVDFSAVALERARAWAATRLGEHADRLTTVVADLTDYAPQAAYDLVLVVYIQLPAEPRRTVLRSAAAAVAPGGRLLVIAHHTDNLAHGHGGPQDPAVLYTADDVASDVEGLGLRPERLETVQRPVTVEGREAHALDALALFTRP
ncbi:MAG: methyltransferase domain-containing protein [Frankiales bacterium]|nr:methyltransferase domain-containing protein [Frankiales bacterium]